jgi:DNA-binding winged helix-turn-helix (wHTH) protein/tetratricopeptide (TPR) repeat protein
MTAERYRFGEYRLELDKRELWRGTAIVPLQLKVFDTLAYLIEHRERAVGRDELISAVWGKADVSDNVLAQIVARARHAVGDSGDEQRLIRTVLRFGYRWVAEMEADVEIEEVEAAASPPSPEEPEAPPPTPASLAPAGIASRSPAPDAEERRRGSTRPVRSIAVAAGLLLALAAAGAYVIRVRTGDATAASPPIGQHAVVLPVTGHVDGANAWIRLGVMDLVAQRLRQAGQPVVPSDTTVALAAGLTVPTPWRSELEGLVAATGASMIVEVHAGFRDGRWRVTVRTAFGREQAISAQADSGDVLEAARSAADRFAAELGLSPPEDDVVPRDAALRKRVQRVRAAILANQLDQASALLEGADEADRRQPEVRYQRAQIALIAGRYEEAEHAFAALLDDVAAGVTLRAEALHGLGLSFFRRADYDTACRHFGDAIQVLSRLSDAEARSVLGRVLNTRGACNVLLGRLDAAFEDAARARLALESSGDSVGLAILDNLSGFLRRAQHRPAEALPFLESAARRAAALRDVAMELRAWINLAEVHLSLLDPAAALAIEPRIRELLVHVADPTLREFAHLHRIKILAENGRLHAARELVAEVHASASVGLRHQAAFADALAARLSDRPDEAARAAESSLGVDWDDAEPIEHARTWLTLVRAYSALGRRPAVAAAAARMVRALEEGRPRPVEVRAYVELVRAEAALADDRQDDARAAFERATALAEDSAFPLVVLDVAEARASRLIRQTDLSAAAVEVARVAAWAHRHFRAALLQVRLYQATGDLLAWQSALARARRLAEERVIPAELLIEPAGRARTVPTARRLE